MKVRAATILADAWGRWRADWPILTAVAGVFVLLPSLAYLLLVPDQPELAATASGTPDDAAMQAFVAAMQVWVGQYGIYYVALTIAVLYAQMALVALYLAPERETVGQALKSAIMRFPQMIGASIAWGLPVLLIALLLMAAGLIIVVMPIMALALARTCLIAPALMAERPIGALAALGRSFRATRGHMLMLASLLLAVLIAQYLLGMPFEMADGWLKAHGPNPIVRTMIDGVAAILTTLGAIAVALIEVAAWRRLA